MTDANTICHDLDLLGDWLSAKGYTEEAGLCLRVLGLIREQQDEIEHWAATHQMMVNEVARLHEALSRIDGLATTICMKNDAGYPIQLGNVMQIYQAARAALISDKLETVNALHGETLEKLDDNSGNPD